MNPSADKSLAFFKTNREVRLEQLLRKFTALDDGDAEYWWSESRRDLIVAALEELGLRDPNAAGQVKTVAGKADRSRVASLSDVLTATAAPGDTPLTDDNVLAEIPGQMWVDSAGVKRDRVLGDFARHLEIELRTQDEANDLLTKRLEEMTMLRNEWKARAEEQTVTRMTISAEAYKNGYDTAIETAAQHVEGQHCVWDNTDFPIEHMLQAIAKNIRALKDAPRPAHQ